MSSIESAPASIPCTSDITLRPGRHAPGALGSSHTDSFTNCSIPNRSASVAVTSKPASLISRSSSNATRTASRFDRPLWNVRTVMHHMGDLLYRPAVAAHDSFLKPCSGGAFKPQPPDGTLGATRWIEA